MPMVACPPDAELAAFLDGAMSATSLDGVGVHVEACVLCLKRLSELESAGGVRASSAPPGSTPAEPAFAAAVEKLLTIDATHAFVPGMMLRDYRLLKIIGEGGMGTVFEARHERLEKHFAVKVIRTGIGSSSARLRFEREMKAVGRLKDDRIVQATDAGEVDGRPFLVMELIEGVNLAQWVKQHGPMPWPQARDVIRQAAEGLAVAHAAGLVHRDVKPSNLMLTPSGQVKILDLGLAAIDDRIDIVTADTVAEAGPGELTTPSRVLGTRDYMAPEQRVNAATVDGRADVYGLGSTLCYLLTGQPPQPGPRCPALTESEWTKLLAVEPSQRYANAMAVAAAMVPKGYRPLKWIGLTVAAAVVIALSVFALRPSATAEPELELALALATEITEPVKAPVTFEGAAFLQARWADHLKLPVTAVDPFGTEYRLIPPGGPLQLTLNSAVDLPNAYYLGKTEVTVEQFARFVNGQDPPYVTRLERSGTGVAFYGPPRGLPVRLVSKEFTWKAPGYDSTPQHPVVFVTHNDALAYCRWLSRVTGQSYRLPSVAEWKWACKAAAGTDYYSGKDPESLNPYEWLSNNSDNHPRPVGLRKPNPWGLHDTAGNVSEHCISEMRSNVALSPGQDPGKTRYVFLVGDCYHRNGTAVAALKKSYSPFVTGPDEGSSIAGFRVLREIPPP